MEYNKKIILKNGQDCIIRNATYEDGPEMSELFVLTHSESDYLRSYPEEHHFDVNAESEFQQLELEVVADNQRAIQMYQSIGFVEFGRNPLGFISKYSGLQELVYMRLVL